MDRVLTLRLPAVAARRLTAHARSLGKTPSALVRELVDREIGDEADEKTVYERTRRYVGAVHDRRIVAGRGARAALESWAPDRRD